MDTMFFIGVNAGLLVLLAVGMISAKSQIKAGRKQTT